MNTNKIRFVITVAIVALLGILFLQGFWIMKSWKFHVRNSRHRVHQAAVHSAHRLEKSHFKRMMRHHEKFTHAKTKNQNEQETKINIIQSSNSDSSIGYDIERKIIVIDEDTIKRIQIKNSDPGFNSESKIAIWNTQLAELNLEEFISDSNILLEINNLPIDSIVSSEMNKEGIEYNYTYEILTSNDSTFLEPTNEKSKNGKAIVVPLFRETLKDQPVFLKIDVAKHRAAFPTSFLLIILTSLLFSGIMIWAFWYVVNGLLKQKRISEIKSDFINNMTHEFKTPISTISLAVDSINHEKVKSDLEKIDYYTSIIKAENKRMNKQVERVLQAAQLEKGELIFEKQKMDLIPVIKEVIQSFDLILEEKSGKINLDISQESINLLADENHLFNVFNNLIDNAIKYCKKSPEIKIDVQIEAKTCFIKIKDNGIGMNSEELDHLFSRFYRAESGTLHNIKGFGLGLNYVKYVVEKHNGKIHVSSTINEGSIFKLQFPII